MSRLAHLEDALVGRLAEALIGGSPVFAAVRGMSGGYRSALRDSLRRERTPAAYVAFTDEPTAPETKTPVRGARFVVLVVAKTLRLEADPRHGDVDSLGAFALLEKARSQLDDYEALSGFRAVILHQKFLEADERIAVYELLYRLWPIIEAPLTFGGQAVAGPDSRMALELGPLAIYHSDYGLTTLGRDYATAMYIRARSIVWRGQLRAADDSALNAIEANLNSLLLSQVQRDIEDGTGRTFTDCVLDKIVMDGSRRSSDDGALVVQDAELYFLQETPSVKWQT